MKTPLVAVALVAAVITLSAMAQSSHQAAASTAYTADSQLKLPDDYRGWTYLTTGFDMSYSEKAPSMHMFDNVFVNPSAYAAFLKTGTWPDKTTFVLEQRRSVSKGSINKHGDFQDTEIMGLEVHLRDDARFPGKWAFFSFDDGGKTAKMIPTIADCYSCHREHGIVDTTFVQFYPTLLPVAKAKGTIAATHLQEIAPVEEK